MTVAAEGFFDRQFEAQVKTGSFELNPFEKRALEYLDGRVLDLGAGLGNLSLEAGRRGHEVTAIERCSTAVGRIKRDAVSEGLSVEALEQDVLDWARGHRGDAQFDTGIAIGLLPFFRREQSLEILDALGASMVAEGKLFINVLIEGTTFMDMFDGDNYHLFVEGELMSLLPGWELLYSRTDSFVAPRDLKKNFQTVVLRKPSA